MPRSTPLHRIILIAWALASTLLASPGCAAELDIDALLDAVEAQRIEHGVAGVGLALVSREKVLWVGGKGLDSLERREPVSADTVFRVGSVTKVFTALGLLILEARGRLRLDDPVDVTVGPGWLVNRWDADAPVSTAQLLEHTAGLHDLTRTQFAHSDASVMSLEDALRVEPDTRILAWKPGLHAVYSNIGYGLAGLVLERAAKQRYEDFIGAELLAALDMRDSGFFLDGRTAAALATGYDTDARTPLPYWHMLFRPFGGLNATPRDMAAFVRLLIDEGRHGGRQLIPPEAMARLHTPSTSLAAREGLRFGYALGIYQWYRDGTRFFGHGGDGDGYLAHFAYEPRSGLGYFVAINAFRPAALRAIRHPIERAIAARAGRAPVAPTPVPTAGELDAYTGRYELAAWRFVWTSEGERAEQAIEIVREGDRLVTVSATGERTALIPVNARHFRREDEPDATSAFVIDDGRLYFQEDESYVRVSP